jgi:hypothetical protein
MESSTKFCKIKLMTDHLIWDEVVPQTKQVLNGYSGSEDTLVEGERIEKSRALTTFGKVPSIILFTKRERERERVSTTLMGSGETACCIVQQ